MKESDLKTGVRLQALYPGAREWFDYAITATTADRVTVSAWPHGGPDTELLKAQILEQHGGVRYRLAARENVTIVIEPAAPRGPARCVRCGLANDYQDGPFTCWQCSQDPWR